MPADPTFDTDKPEAQAGAATGKGSLQAWLPLILAIVLMPALAYAMTTFVLLPRLQSALGVHATETTEAGHGGGENKGHGAEATAGKAKYKAQLSKIVVNVSGSLGTRLLLASFTLAGNGSDFKSLVEDNADQLRDLAASTLSSKTIADLEKPEARNMVRSELLSQFNGALGGGIVQEIYITEFAIQ